MNFLRLVSLAITLILSTSVNASIVSSLPHTGTPDWSDVTFSGTSMVVNGSGISSTLTTAPYKGVWFGWLAGQNLPSWTPGSSSDGNYLSFDASFSSNATDWSAYFYDKNHYAAFNFAETGCDGNQFSCYGLTGNAGVSVAHAGATSLDADSTFIPLDLTLPHSYEFLMKNGLVSYRIDGAVVYSGLAYELSLSSPALIIGDSSGSTGTGQGSMIFYSVAFNNTVQDNALVSSVPAPAAVWLFGSGLLGLVGFARRKAS